MNWKELELGSIAKLLSGGTPSKQRAEYWGGNIPWVSAKDLKTNRIFDSELHLTEKGVSNGTKMVPENTVLFVVRGMSLANEFRISLSKVPVTFNQDLKAVNLPKDIDAVFLFYSLFARRNHIRQLAGEASHGTKKLPTEIVESIKLKFPDYPTQKIVGQIASQYDDLIENNRRRIQLLEESARLLYREWFVHLRFPGHEHVKIIDGVPEGWSRRQVGDLAKVQSGFAFKSRDWKEEGNPVIKIKNLTGDGSINISDCDCVDDNIAEGAHRFILSGGDLLIAMTGATVGKVGIMPKTEKKYYLNQRVGLFKSVSDCEVECLLYPFFLEDFTQFQVQNLAGGAAQPNISGKQIESLEIVLPNRRFLQLYIESTYKQYKLREVLIEQNEKLVQARDLLLPRLMNGEITV